MTKHAVSIAIAQNVHKVALNDDCRKRVIEFTVLKIYKTE